MLKEMHMTIKGNVKEAAGYVKEELGEKMNDEKMAQEGRNMRNEGRIEDGKMPKLTKPGTTGNHSDADDADAE